MKKIVYTISAVSIAFLTSCGDFLEPKSQSEYSPKDVSALNELILGNGIPKSTSVSIITAPLTVVDDDITCHPYVALTTGQTENHYERNDFLALQSLYTWQPDYSWTMQARSFNYFDMYVQYYTYISGNNAALDYLPKVTGSDEEKNYVKAQALTLRAYYYFQLVNIYGAPYNKNKSALGIPLKLTAAIEERAYTRNTVEEAYTQIVNDLLEAESLFSDLPSNKKWQRDYRPGLPMTQLLLSRVYLYMENWAKAVEYSNKVINDWSFSLVNLSTLSAGTYYQYTTYDSPEVIWLFGSSSGDISRFASTILMSGTSATANSRPTVFQASEDLLNSYSTGDLRKDAYIVREPADNTKYRAYGKVFIDENNKPTTGNSSFGLTFRLSEAYLIYAEANAMLYKNGNSASKGLATKALNELRSKRFDAISYTDIPDMSADDLVAFSRDERRRELCFEAHRWFDLRRYGMPEIKHTWVTSDTPKAYTLRKDDNSYTFPIPHTIMQNNSDLVQNPLFSGERVD